MDPFILEPKQTAKAAVIWLHGLGASGDDFVPLIPQLGPELSNHVRFIFPHAPVRPITLNLGMPMPGWYDIVSIDRDAPQDEAGVVKSSDTIKQLIKAQQADFANDKILLAGFSQGGAIALYSGLTYDKPLAGVLALSTYLPIADTFKSQRQTANQKTPIMMMHGSQDPIVPLKFARLSHQTLDNLGYQVTWQEYPMEHSLCPPQIETIATWLKEILL